MIIHILNRNANVGNLPRFIVKQVTVSSYTGAATLFAHMSSWIPQHIDFSGFLKHTYWTQVSKGDTYVADSQRLASRDVTRSDTSYQVDAKFFENVTVLVCLQYSRYCNSSRPDGATNVPTSVLVCR